MRHRLNLRKYPRGLPQRLHRVYARTENFGFRAAFAISDFFAISSRESLIVNRESLIAIREP